MRGLLAVWLLLLGVGVQVSLLLLLGRVTLLLLGWWGRGSIAAAVGLLHLRLLLTLGRAIALLGRRRAAVALRRRQLLVLLRRVLLLLIVLRRRGRPLLLRLLLVVATLLLGVGRRRRRVAAAAGRSHALRGTCRAPEGAM